MAKKLSLADKYAQYKGNSLARSERNKYTNYRPKPPVSPIRKDLAKPKYPHLEQWKKEPKLPGLFGSPIKALFSSPSSTKRPSSIYKVLPFLPRKFTRNDLDTSYRIQKDRSWLNSKTGNPRSKQTGLFVKLRGFLSSLKFDSANEELKTLTASAKEVLKIPSQESRTVSLDELGIPRRARQFDDYKDFDEVDANVQLAKERLQRDKSRKENLRLEEKIRELETEIKTLREQHERELYLAKADNKAQILDLNEKVTHLSSMASSRYQEIEREKLQEIENAVMRENESFLIYQKETEKVFEEMKRKLDDKDQHLQNSEERLEAREKALIQKEKELADKLRMFEEQEQKWRDTRIQALQKETRKPQRSEHIPHHTDGAISDENLNGRIRVSKEDALSLDVQRALQESQAQYDTEMAVLNQEKDLVSEMIRKNDTQVIEILDTMQRISEVISANAASMTVSDKNVLYKLEEFVETLGDNTVTTSAALDQCLEKFKEYRVYFDEFQAIFADDRDKAAQLYGEYKLMGIESSFAKLKKSITGKIAKRTHQIRELQTQIDRAAISESNYSVYSIEVAANGAKKRADLLKLQDGAVTTLHELALLQKTLNDMQTLMGWRKHTTPESGV